MEIICYPLDEQEFVQPATLMKEAIHSQLDSDSILRMVTNAANQKYQDIENKAEEDESQQVMNQEIHNDVENKMEL